MPIDTHCRPCDERYRLADRQRGKKIRCKVCERVFVADDVSRLSEGIQETPSSKPAIVPPWQQRKEGDRKPAARSRFGKGKPLVDNPLIVAGILGFFFLVALGVGIWVALRNTGAETPPGEGRVEAPQQPPRPGPKPPRPGPNLIDTPMPPVQPREPAVGEMSVDELLDRAQRPDGNRREQALEELARRKEKRGVELATRL